ncbi:MAG: 5'-nucleotidase C-terminal domain-containing protein [Bacteroidia bacterium]|nr:5'-nucleotidase C-terminal domain-containing protein [Bacteroidia bacterium]
MFPLYTLLLLLACRPPVSIQDSRADVIRLSDSTGGKDSLTERIIAPYREKLEKDMNEVLGYADTLLEKGQPESLLGNAVADLVLIRGNLRLSGTHGYTAQVCLLNNGGLRTSIPKGPITRGKIYELMPFENQLVALTITGQQMSDLAAYLASSGGMPVSGIQMKIVNKSPAVVIVNGTELNKKTNYVILTSDYLAAGGDKMSFFSNPVKTDTLDYLLRDAIIDHIRSLQLEGKKLSGKKDGRIRYE